MHLNVLLLSDSLQGHLSNLLAVGEELVHRGHNVTLCMMVVLDQTDEERYRSLVERHGIHMWLVTGSKEYLITLEDLKRPVKYDIVWTMLFEIRSRGSHLMNTMAKTINKSLSDGEWDIVLGNDLIQVLVSCVHSAHKIPSVVVGTSLQTTVELYPPWSWPNPLHGASSDNLGFVERFLNAPFKLALKLFVAFMFSSFKDALTDYCPSLTLQQAMTDTGVRIPFILPTVIGVEYPRTIMPLVDLVGPILPQSPAPLSRELQEWLDSKPARSVVYISMGSMFPVNEVVGRAVLEGVLQAKYSVLWSLRESNQWILNGVYLDSSQVLILDWTPQLSVLGSKAIHSAILHGGFNGVNEALWNGVPVIAVPLTKEQLYSAGRLHFNGLGIYLNRDEISKSLVAESLKALDIGDYRVKISTVRKMFDLAGGVQRAADLVEFYEEVGYGHLMPAYVKYHWSWVQYYNADVYGLIAVVVAAVLVCSVKCCTCVCRRCCLTGTRKAKTD